MTQNLLTDKIFIGVIVVIAIVITLMTVLLLGLNSPNEELLNTPANIPDKTSATSLELEEFNEREDILATPITQINNDVVSAPSQHQIIDFQKIIFNPLGCQADENGLIRIQIDTGQCLQTAEIEKTIGVNPVDQIVEEEIDDNELAVKFFKPFNYDPKLDAVIHSLTCRYIDETTPSPFNESFWRDSNTVYTDNTDGLNSQEVNNQLAEGHTYSQQRCRIVMAGINIGEDTYLADGCGLVFERSVSLIGQSKTYPALNLQQICTKNTIDFPRGATDREELHFVVDLEDEITKIIIKGSKTYFLPVIYGQNDNPKQPSLTPWRR